MECPILGAAKMHLRIVAAGFVVAMLLVAGCGERTYKVSGTVNFDGKPVENGTIVFEAADGAGLANAGISNGKYELHSKIGKKKVVISAFRKVPGTEKDQQPPLEAYLPAKYNTESTLFREVTATDNRFDFNLEK
jgi:hypothetical protein